MKRFWSLDKGCSRTIEFSTAAAALNAAVTRQAVMVAYINNFALMMIIAIGSCSLLFLIRPSRSDVRAPALDPRTMRPRRAG